MYAIDPSTDKINFINEMCYINDVSNVKTLNYAISDKNEILMTKDNLNHCSFVYKNKKNINNEKKYINAVSLDYLLQEKIINNIFTKIKEIFISKGFQLILIPSMRTPKSIIHLAKNYFDDNQIIINDVDKNSTASCCTNLVHASGSPVNSVTIPRYGAV